MLGQLGAQRGKPVTLPIVASSQALQESCSLCPAGDAAPVGVEHFDDLVHDRVGKVLSAGCAATAFDRPNLLAQARSRQIGYDFGHARGLADIVACRTSENLPKRVSVATQYADDLVRPVRSQPRDAGQALSTPFSGILCGPGEVRRIGRLVQSRATQSATCGDFTGEPGKLCPRRIEVLGKLG